MAQYPQLGVRPYLTMPLDYEGTRIPFSSYLFRRNAQLPRVLASLLHYRDPDNTDPLSVLSVGASFGAEADSVLALVEGFTRQLGPVSLTGIDTNADTVVRARHGMYQVTRFENRADEDKIRSKLPSLLGTLTWERIEGLYGGFRERWVIDTNTLRARHNVNFLHADLTKRPDGVLPADIVLCNNVLFHLSVGPRNRLIDAAADYVKPGGILSMEEATEDYVALPNANKDYFEWRQTLPTTLTAKGFVPFLADGVTSVPSAFQAVQN